MLDTIENLTTSLRNKPSMWTSPDVKSHFSFVYEASSKPSVYPPYIDLRYSSAIQISYPDNSISKDFMSKHFDQYMHSRVEIEFDPVRKDRLVSTRHQMFIFDSNAGNNHTSK